MRLLIAGLNDALIAMSILFLIHRMKLQYCFPQKLNIYVSIKFGGCNRFVTQELLDRSQICTVFEQMCGKRMPESVRTDIFMNTGHNGKFLHDCKNHHPGQSAAATVEKQVIFMPFFDVQMVAVIHPEIYLLLRFIRYGN